MDPYLAALLLIISCCIACLIIYFIFILGVEGRNKVYKNNEVNWVKKYTGYSIPGAIISLFLVIACLSTPLFFYNQVTDGFQRQDNESVIKTNTYFTNNVKQVNKFINEANKYYKTIGKYGDKTELIVITNNDNVLPNKTTYNVSRIPNGAFIRLEINTSDVQRGVSRPYFSLSMSIIVKKGEITKVNCSRSAGEERGKKLLNRIVNCKQLKTIITK